MNKVLDTIYITIKLNDFDSYYMPYYNIKTTNNNFKNINVVLIRTDGINKKNENYYIFSRRMSKIINLFINKNI